LRSNHHDVENDRLGIVISFMEDIENFVLLG
jgi:hypothetical protein